MDRVLADHEALRDLAVGESPRDQAQDLDFATGHAGALGSGALASELRDELVGLHGGARGPELLERRARSKRVLESRGGAVLSRQRASQLQPDLRRLEWRVAAQVQVERVLERVAGQIEVVIG